MSEAAFAPVPQDLAVRLLHYSRELLQHCLRESADRSGAGEPTPPGDHPILREPLGLFVTLRRGAELRGCIGSITTTDPLQASIRRRTLDAALQDRRFAPVNLEELPELCIEHSVLSTPAWIAGADRIVPGRHGVILTIRSARAVFLPEVAVHQGWSVPEMLNALSIKAGQARDAWRGNDAELQVFQTQHYQEEVRP